MSRGYYSNEEAAKRDPYDQFDKETKPVQEEEEAIDVMRKYNDLYEQYVNDGEAYKRYISQLQQTIADLQEEVKRVNIGREKARAKRNEYEKRVHELGKQIINQRLRISELESLLNNSNKQS